MFKMETTRLLAVLQDRAVKGSPPGRSTRLDSNQKWSELWVRIVEVTYLGITNL